MGSLSSLPSEFSCVSLTAVKTPDERPVNTNQKWSEKLGGWSFTRG